MLTGSIVAMVTPMHSDGRIDFTRLRGLVDFHVDAGTAAIVSVGTSGESATLSMQEQIEVIAKTLAAADGRLPIIAGTGANSTSEALELTAAAAELGVNACLLVTPYYNKPPQRGMYQHFSKLAQSVNIPQILYNVPGRTAVDLDNATVAELAQIPNIIGIKDATGDITRVAELRKLCGDEFALYSGDDATTLEFIRAGGNGCISVTANVAPQKMSAMCRAAVAGDFNTAEKLNEDLEGLHTSLFVEANPIPAKWAVAELGLMEKGIRLPLVTLADEHQNQVKAAMQVAGVA